MQTYALLILQDGSQFIGKSIGADGETVGEVVFNTSMTGYQEILTDPSYCEQLVTLTYPHIGNVGTNNADAESNQVFAKGLIIRDLPLLASNYRNELDLSSYLKQHNVIAIADIDTRRLTRILREKGAQHGVIITAYDKETILEKADTAKQMAIDFKGLSGLDLAQKVTCTKSYLWTQGVWTREQEYPVAKNALPYHVVAYDFGVKRNILRMLVERGCKLTIVPAKTSAQEVLALNPDGIFLSNGPGDPAPCTYAIDAIKQFLATDIPIFGICLGHQLLALACGAKTIKMKFGHHGGNHPVKDLENNRVMITAQNHGFAVDEMSLPTHLRVTHKSLFDGSLQGIHHNQKPAFSFQGHPEASPGPHDAAPLFDHFIELIKIYKQEQ
ncbi:MULTISPECIES: glutamine-hydrolyzing carbamoyl-phosphate synthase small subunit [unclassified Gilliamella]|uniref:glutamine-hydrolyzing carbamoyl-phosphate synthase small subunit n=1 Tax=unclassified Gilliamella TaxID=2685620 RepID=UPI00226A5521|nr:MULTISPECIES: glutamine-hydrolyzing carbamoyl-phosphate synthase small subunit [unclassified Gilliamella]MCX8597513.1 glutamine-hydrolyzing carbamoyl-phosphate synthase small subunit [Gilliamella sp. B3493]MCX8599704.1 glutamine-hydrolyzing carbamoyl-phosphate synthase small subunit [Gilliamella sp. B3486]MCX8689979.1 glutamine-hydrolyzing carbamoyl-phosphate synthase small subunit [Gilliamella sp. B2973]MCX8705804.1 glutamine-hydrolyzing carbamoyl-phosphate synthase small subunit [Gilliamel